MVKENCIISFVFFVCLFAFFIRLNIQGHILLGLEGERADPEQARRGRTDLEGLKGQRS